MMVLITDLDFKKHQKKKQEKKQTTHTHTHTHTHTQLNLAGNKTKIIYDVCNYNSRRKEMFYLP